MSIFHMAVHVGDPDGALTSCGDLAGSGEGRPGEQATIFVLDPFGNGSEFTSMRDPSGSALAS